VEGSSVLTSVARQMGLLDVGCVNCEMKMLNEPLRGIVGGWTTTFRSIICRPLEDCCETERVNFSSSVVERSQRGRIAIERRSYRGRIEDCNYRL